MAPRANAGSIGRVRTRDSFRNSLHFVITGSLIDRSQAAGMQISRGTSSPTLSRSANASFPVLATSPPAAEVLKSRCYRCREFISKDFFFFLEAIAEATKS
jgi:hypothetical protein